jgi:hypothetical protein
MNTLPKVFRLLRILNRSHRVTAQLRWRRTIINRRTTPTLTNATRSEMFAVRTRTMSASTAAVMLSDVPSGILWNMTDVTGITVIQIAATYSQKVACAESGHNATKTNRKDLASTPRTAAESMREMHKLNATIETPVIAAWNFLDDSPMKDGRELNHRARYLDSVECDVG